MFWYVVDGKVTMFTGQCHGTLLEVRLRCGTVEWGVFHAIGTVTAIHRMTRIPTHLVLCTHTVPVPVYPYPVYP